MDMNAVSRRISETRRAQNITQEELAAMADLSPTHIGVIERAAKVPSLSTFVAIANALGVSSDHLLQDVIDNNYESQAQEIARLVSSQSPEMQRKLCKAVQALVEE